MAPNSTEHKNLIESDEGNDANSQLIKRKANEGELLAKPVHLIKLN